MKFFPQKPPAQVAPRSVLALPSCTSRAHFWCEKVVLFGALGHWPKFGQSRKSIGIIAMDSAQWGCWLCEIESKCKNIFLYGRSRIRNRSTQFQEWSGKMESKTCLHSLSNYLVIDPSTIFIVGKQSNKREKKKEKSIF